MSGHSKWSTIKRKKGKEDAKRGQIFGKLAKAITVAAKDGGGNPDNNITLANAIDKARQNNMPADNIERAIKRGTGEIEGASYEEIIYEGYGAAGVAVLVNILTDNRNRVAADIRHIFSKHGGNLGTTGSVAWIFEAKGVALIPKDAVESEEKLLEVLIEADIDDIKHEDGHFEVVCETDALEDVKKLLDAAGIKYVSAESTMIPKNTVKLDQKGASSVLRLVEALEEHDDVQDVYANFDIPDEIMEELAAAS